MMHLTPLGPPPSHTGEEARAQRLSRQLRARPCRVLSTLGALAILLPQHGALAAAPTESSDAAVAVRLEVVADPSCATSSQLARRIAVRSDKVQIVEQGGSRRVRAKFERYQGVVRATLTVETNGRFASRRVQTASCEQAVDALGLIAALTLDPSSAARAGGDAPLPLGAAKTDAGKEPPQATKPSAGSGDPRTDPERPQTKRGRTREAERRRRARQEQKRDSAAAGARAEAAELPEAVEASEPEAYSPPVTRRVRLRASVAGSVSAGPAPTLVPGGALGGMVGWEGPSLWSPAARLTVSHARSAAFAARYGTAHFYLTTVGVDLCPLWFWAGPLSVRPCASAVGGVLTASGSDTVDAASDSRPWWVVGGSALVSVLVTPTAEVSGGVLLGRPLVRDRFQFSPEVFHTVDKLSWTASLGAGLRFP